MRLASLLRRSDTSNDPPARAPAIQRPTQSTPQIPPVSSPLTPSSSAGLNAVAGPSSPAGSSSTAPIAIRIPNSDSIRTPQPIPSYDEALSTSASAIPGSPDFSEGAGIARMSLRGRAMSANMINTQSMAMRDRMAISTSDTVWNEEDEESDEDPVPRGSGTRSNLSSSLPRMLDPTLRRNTISALRPSAYAVQSSEYGLFNDSQLSLGLPTPPTETPPEYSPHLARDELRLISTVHLDENHPAAVMFSSMASTAMMTSAVRALHPEPTRPSDGNLCVTGNKKLKVSITRGGERYNNGTGPTFIRLGRKGVVEGSIHLGKVDHVTGLDISIIGLVNTSYYVRGQYTLIDTLPLARRLVVIYPEDKAGTYDNMNTTQPSTAANATTSEAPPAPETTPLQRQTTASSTSADSANPPADPPPTESTAPAPDASEQPSASTSAPPPFPVNTVTIGKDTFLAPFQEFKFSLKIPDNHYRDPNSELPPTSQIYQVGMQASIEYVLRVKCSRKGWRMNEGLAIPVLYEPRAYITPRRLRALTTHDALNPGWRTIKLNGGKPKPTPESEPVAPVLPGVDVQLLLPSPPILYVEHGTAPSPIPFHLHFHSSSALPLATFSDPRQCKFVVRLMRVASMKIGVEKEVRRVEIPTKCELWQEGGERFVLGEDDVDAVETTSTGPTLRRGSLGGATNPGPGERRRSFTERRQSFLRRMSNAPSNDDSTPAQSQPPISPVSPTSPTPISLAGTGDIGLSRSISASTITSPMAIPGPPTMARAVSNAPVVSSIQEESEITSRGASPEDPSVPAITTAITEQTPSLAGELPATAPAYSPIAEGSEVTRHPLLAPLTLDATDVHLLGQLTIYPTMAGTTVARHLIQSFLSPEIGVTYVVEVGMQPKKGAVKETFSHVWGGGLIEVVLGPRPEPEASEPAPGATGAVPSVMATSTS